MIPSTFPAVDGSARTLICVDVVPSTGAIVGWGGGGSGVSEGRGVKVGDRIEVTGNAVGEGAMISRGLALHPAIQSGTRTSMML